MLVLSRKLGEKIQIGEDICITVVDIDRGKIRLGIEAPREVPIFRQELGSAPKSWRFISNGCRDPVRSSAIPLSPWKGRIGNDRA